MKSARRGVKHARGNAVAPPRSIRRTRRPTMSMPIAHSLYHSPPRCADGNWRRNGFWGNAVFDGEKREKILDFLPGAQHARCAPARACEFARWGVGRGRWSGGGLHGAALGAAGGGGAEVVAAVGAEAGAEAFETAKGSALADEVPGGERGEEEAGEGPGEGDAP